MRLIAIIIISERGISKELARLSRSPSFIYLISSADHKYLYLQ